MKKVTRQIMGFVVLIVVWTIGASAADWTSMTSGTTNDLNDIWGSSATDMFAVGASGTILHYDGSTWTSMSSGTVENLSGVWGVVRRMYLRLGPLGRSCIMMVAPGHPCPAGQLYR